MLLLLPAPLEAASPLVAHWPALGAHSRKVVCLVPRSFLVCAVDYALVNASSADIPMAITPQSSDVFDAQRSLYEPPVDSAKAIRDFAQPIQRLITGYTVSAKDLSDFVKSIPALLQSIDQPFDVTKVRKK